MFSLFRLCGKDEISRKTRSTLLPFLAAKSNVDSTKSNVASILLLVWTGLYRPVLTLTASDGGDVFMPGSGRRGN